MHHSSSGRVDPSLLANATGIVFPYDESHFTNTTAEETPAASTETSGGGGGPSPFYIFPPILGVVVLFSGFYMLRKRQRRQDDDSLRRYQARVESVSAERRQKQELRLSMIDSALITTKAVLPRQKLSKARPSCTDTDPLSEFSLSSSSLNVSRRFLHRMSSSFGDEEEALPAEKPAKPYSNLSSAASEAMASGADTLVLENAIGSMDSKMETCAICLEPYREYDSVSYSRHQNCSHVFHTDCIVSWLKDQGKNDCPCCRGPYLHLSVSEDNAQILPVTDQTADQTTSQTVSQATPSSSPDAFNAVGSRQIQTIPSNEEIP